MSVRAWSLDKMTSAADRRAEARRRQRQEVERTTVPLRLYGVKRGGVALVTAASIGFAVFTLVPLVWVLINSTKTQANLFSSFGFWFAKPFYFVQISRNCSRTWMGRAFSPSGSGTPCYTLW